MAKKDQKKYEKLNIKNKNYQKLSDQPIYITPELKNQLQKSNTKYGTRFSLLETYGFKGGKHLIEYLKKGIGGKFDIILTHEMSKIKDKEVFIEVQKYKSLNVNLFRAIYQETGNKAARSFLGSEFPNKFKNDEIELPSKKEVAKVINNLDESISTLSKKQQKEIPKKIIDLIQNGEPNFIYQILSAVDGSSQRFQLELKTLLEKIPKDKNSTRGLEDLSEFMDKWNLHQITSLLSIVKSRLQTIETFEQMIHDEKTYEIIGDKSIHRILENSMWLVDDKYWIVSSNKSLRNFIGESIEKEDKKYSKKRPDFVCVDHDNKTIILEIKRPSVELKKEEIDQAVLYLRMIKKYRSQKKPIEVYLIGNTISEEARDIAELMPTIKLQTYQDFLEKCRARYKQYLTVVEN